MKPALIARGTLRRWAVRQVAFNKQRVVAGSFTAGYENAMNVLIERLDRAPKAPRKLAK